MISWLKGQIIQKWQNSSKKGVVLNVNGVGYELHLLPKQINSIDKNNIIEFWIHQINREDSITLYGFKNVNQRDLFRIIICINGIGPQIGMSLLDDFEVFQLVNAIELSDIEQLTKSQGIGKRIAERLVVELKNKLHKFKDTNQIENATSKVKPLNDISEYLEEIKSILNSLGYDDNEIKDSIKFINNDKEEITFQLNSLSSEAKTALMDNHLKEILIRLTQNST